MHHRLAHHHCFAAERLGPLVAALMNRISCGARRRSEGGIAMSLPQCADDSRFAFHSNTNMIQNGQGNLARLNLWFIPAMSLVRCWTGGLGCPAQQLHLSGIRSTASLPCGMELVSDSDHCDADVDMPFRNELPADARQRDKFQQRAISSGNC